MPTAGTGPARIVLILQGHSHPQPLRFVGELEADRAVGPLVNFLVVGMPNIVVLPDIAHIANDHGLHACLMQRGDEPRGLLMFDILILCSIFLNCHFLDRMSRLRRLLPFFIRPSIRLFSSACSLLRYWTFERKSRPLRICVFVPS